MPKRRTIFALLILVVPVFSCFSLRVRGSVPPAPQQESGGLGTSAAAPATIGGTVTDTNDQPVIGASVDAQGGSAGAIPTVTTNETGFFEIGDLQAGIPYQVTVSAPGFAAWQSPVLTLTPGQRVVVDVGKLRILAVETTVTVTPEGTDEMAVEQVKTEERQRGFGFLPNFLAVYDPNPAPLTNKLKFALSFRVARDPFTVVGLAFIAGLGQAARTPDYVEGLKGFGERLGAEYANQFTTIMIGGAVLPSLLHQDPRYFYQGSGTRKSRAFHAIVSLFVTRGESGRSEPNFSTFGGDFASAAISNLYYPASNRGVGLVFENFGLNTAVHAGVRLLQEFVFGPAKGTVVGNAAENGSLVAK